MASVKSQKLKVSQRVFGVLPHVDARRAVSQSGGEPALREGRQSGGRVPRHKGTGVDARRATSRRVPGGLLKVRIGRLVDARRVACGVAEGRREEVFRQLLFVTSFGFLPFYLKRGYSEFCVLRSS